jgi:alcohol dehydrogenase class IV
MISPFNFARIPQIIFGAGKVDLLPDLLNKYGKNVLIITGGTSFSSGKAWPVLTEKLNSRSVNYQVFQVKHEPSPELINQCTDLYRDQKIDVVVGIGGGSVLDAGKAVSAMLPLKEDVSLYLEGVGTRAHNGSKIPFIAVPTTSGTGSEATKNAVLSRTGVDGFKKSLRHDNFVPDIALIDPLLTLTCPPGVTAYSGMDAFTQLLESYLSPSSGIICDSVVPEGLRCIRRSLLPSFENGHSDMAARTEMSYAALISGITLANAGLGTIHGFASSAGGYFDIPHGVICSRLMYPVNKLTVNKLQKSDPGNIALKKYAQTGRIFAENEHHSDGYYISYLLDYISDLTDKLQIPRLSDYGISEKDFDRIVNATENKNNPVALDWDELKEALAEGVNG